MIEIIQSGGEVMWVLVVMSVVALTVLLVIPITGK